MRPALAAALLLAAAAATTAAAPLPAAATSSRHHRRHRPKVEIVVFGEALCPDTAAFFDRVLRPAVEAGVVGPPPRRRGVGGAEGDGGDEDDDDDDDDGGDDDDDDDDDGDGGGATALSSRHRRPLATVRYVGWGNAARSPSTGAVTFQHGPREGELDAALNCAAGGAGVSAPAASRRANLDLLLCYFTVVAVNGTGPAGGQDAAAIAGCAARAGVRGWEDRVLACAGGAGGAALARAAEAETAALAPPKNFVPWVTVGGEAMAGECGDLVRWVCDRAGGGGGGGEDRPACAAARGKPAPPCPGAPRVVVSAAG